RPSEPGRFSPRGGHDPARARADRGAVWPHRGAREPVAATAHAGASPDRRRPREARRVSRLFGTDGIRAGAHAEPLTTELAFRLGRQLVATLIEHHGLSKTRLVVGRDTRLSGPMLEGALVSGALSAGADVYSMGVLPTPGIAQMTRRLEAHCGVVLSASHNPFQDNGIKIFSGEGAKFPDAWEEEIEGRLRERDVAPWPTGADIGRLVPSPDAEGEYLAHLRGVLPLDLGGMAIAVDCAHAATYH